MSDAYDLPSSAMAHISTEELAAAYLDAGEAATMLSAEIEKVTILRDEYQAELMRRLGGLGANDAIQAQVGQRGGR